MKCTYCNNLLICETCGAEYQAQTPEQYEAMTRAEMAVDCPSCETRLVCHWCKTPYDGGEGDTLSASRED